MTAVERTAPAGRVRQGRPRGRLPHRRSPRLGAPARCGDLRRAHRHRPQLPVRRPPAARCHRHPILPTGGTPQRRLLLAGAPGQRQRPGRRPGPTPPGGSPGPGRTSLASVHPTREYRQRNPLFYEWDPVEHASSYRVHLYDADGRQLCKTERTSFTTLQPLHQSPGSEGACVPVQRRQLLLARPWPSTTAANGSTGMPSRRCCGRERTGFSYSPPAGPSDAGPARRRHRPGRLVRAGRALAPGDAAGLCTRRVPDQCDRLPQTPVLTWDPVPGATSYRVLFTNDAAGTNPYQDSGVGRRHGADLDADRLIPRQPGWLRLLLAGAAL